MTTSQMVKWATGFTAGVGTLIWLHSTFLTKESHRAYIESHKQWGDAVLSAIHGDMEEIKGDIKEIKTILVGKKVAIAPNTNYFSLP